MNLSVCIATYNEEANIARCLLSIKDLADEIIIVDGGSTDKTAQIAKQLGAKVIETTNPPIFHINKQKAIARARGDWIFQLDADEQVTKDLREEIIKTISNNPEENGFWIPRKNYFLGRFLSKGGQYPDYTLRLYRNGKGRLPGKSVHEQAHVDGKVGYLEHPLIHMADPSLDHYLLRFNRYTSLIADELNDEHLSLGLISFLQYFIFKPVIWFLATFIRHKGFIDGFHGFVFSFFSSLRFPVAYIKYWESTHAHRH